MHAGLAGPTLTAPPAVRPVRSLLERGEIVETSAGPHLRIAQAVEEFWKDAERLVAARHAISQGELAAKGRAIDPPSPENSAEGCSYRSEARALVKCFPDRTIFLDLETCGLAGAALFLVGLLRRIDGRLTVELLLARTYAEEKAVLVSLWERIAYHEVLVTFNGKSFDWPMVLDRSTRYLLHRAGSAGGASFLQSSIPSSSPSTASRPSARDQLSVGAHRAPALGTTGRVPAGAHSPMVHVDILHHARRRWRGRLPNCKLQTLERYICGRRREGDIPGANIPAAYQQFVNSGNPCQMESILFHNALDLVTLLDLSLRLANE